MRDVIEQVIRTIGKDPRLWQVGCHEGEGGLVFHSGAPWERGWPGLCFLPPLHRDKQPWVMIQQLQVWGFSLAFVVYFAHKKREREMGGVKLMRWVWVISHSNHWHLQWQDLSAYVIVHCSNSLSLKFSACIMFLKIYHENIKDLM